MLKTKLIVRDSTWHRFSVSNQQVLKIKGEVEMGQIIFSWYDGLIFLVFFLIVVAFSMYKSRKEKTGEDYFLAGRQLIWPLIGLKCL